MGERSGKEPVFIYKSKSKKICMYMDAFAKFNVLFGKEARKRAFTKRWLATHVCKTAFSPPACSVHLS